MSLKRPMATFMGSAVLFVPVLVEAGTGLPISAHQTHERAAGSIPLGCYPDTVDTQRLESQGNPPEGARFLTATTVWVGEGVQGPSGRAQPAHLTYSFPDDGTTWGLRLPFGPNDLNAGLIEAYGDLDLGREYMRQAIASWSAVTGLQYTEVADDNSPMDGDIIHVATRGDIRLGGQDLDFTVLGYNGFPNEPPGEGNSGGDMVVNTFFFDSYFTDDPETTFRFFRHVVAHEHGHGLGYFHVAPCTSTKIMEPTVPFGGIEPLPVDEIRGGGRNYGDRFAGNQSQQDAVDFGVLVGGFRQLQAIPQAHSVVEADLSTNGLSGFGGTNNDWFTFGLSRKTSVTITADPTGGTYNAGTVGPECTEICDAFDFDRVGGICPPIVADEAGDLALELYDENGLLLVSDTAPPGDSESITAQLGAGSYWIHVVDEGPNPSTNGILQLFDLSVLVQPLIGPGGTIPIPPRAVAGIDKRCAVNKNCYFIGDLNSRANDPSATGLLTFSWDLDGDGIFEVFNDPRPVKAFTSTGSFDVTLLVTDSNGGRATDTITVAVDDPPGRCCFSGVQPPQLCAYVTETECGYLNASQWTPAANCNEPCEPDVTE